MRFEAGQELFETTATIDRARLIRYAGASGDFNPIHWNDRFAREVGLDGVIAHGMLTMGAAASPVAEWLGDAGVVSDYQVRFTRMVPVDGTEGADVTVTAVVGVLDAEARTARIDLKVVFSGQTVLGKSQLVVAFA